jgi:Dolichyl-phosphate-mannose-protein mannosyltransferase
MTAVNKETTPFRRRLMLIIIAGILARAAVIVYSNQNPKLFDFPDSRRYFTVARNIVAGNGPIDSPTVRAGTDPLYPILLSISAFAGFDSDEHMFLWAQLLNTLTSICAFAAIASIAGKLFGPVVGMVSAALFALDPITLFFNALALTETIYSTLLLVAINHALPTVAPRDARLAIRCLSIGALFGIAALTRSSGLFLPLAIAGILWKFLLPAQRRFTAVALVLAAYVFMLSPTILRNHFLFNEFVPIRTGSGASLMEALGPWADGGPGMDRIVYPPFPPNANEYERDKICRNAALDWAKQNPGRVLSLAWTKLLRTWSITINASSYASPLYKAVGWLTVAPVFALALMGVVLLRSQRATLALLLAPVAYFTILHMIFVGSVRYRMPAMPFVFILAAVAMTRIIDRQAAKA